ncbi:MAG: elongation factor P maturation arginine rhamnosyltransferase EarP [Burkholderiaceae bacterium]|nr:elongation factor P maturation arginine rhamnosyltransferase EarP [Burkholderiaceae bacterium]MDP1968506.1 elongation factor P maturation arginine rhamnosyltransferase EarP [Burkholderiaceae bacterium]
MLWNLFCKAIDNYGDIGVCWRLAALLGARGERVRLWLDQPQPVRWMAPAGAPGVEVVAWTPTSASTAADAGEPGDVVIEAFGCELPAGFLAAMAAAARAGRAPVWINLEYLTAEAFAERSHGLRSPVLSGPAAGLDKYFFYPGFSPATGGLLREPDLARRRAAFDRSAWLQAQGIAARDEMLVSLFCYEPASLPGLLDQLAAGPRASRLLVTAGRAQAAVRSALADQARAEAGSGALAVTYLPWLTQTDYDHLLWACDFNFVRGEDSLVRALWAGKAFAWQIYPQNDGAHAAKLQAFLACLAAGEAWQHFHRVWNGLAPGPLPVPDLPAWGAVCVALRARLESQDDLLSQLLGFVRKKR